MSLLLLFLAVVVFIAVCGYTSASSNQATQTTTHNEVGVQGTGAAGQSGQLKGSTQAAGGALVLGPVTGARVSGVSAKGGGAKAGGKASSAGRAKPAGAGKVSSATASNVNASTNVAVTTNDPATALAALQSNTLIAGAALTAATNGGLANLAAFNALADNSQNTTAALDTLTHVSTLAPPAAPAPQALEYTAQGITTAPASNNTTLLGLLGAALAGAYYLFRK